MDCSLLSGGPKRPWDRFSALQLQLENDNKMATPTLKRLFQHDHDWEDRLHHWIGGCVGHKAVWKMLRKFLTLPGLELQPIASHYADCAILAPQIYDKQLQFQQLKNQFITKSFIPTWPMWNSKNWNHTKIHDKVSKKYYRILELWKNIHINIFKLRTVLLVIISSYAYSWVHKIAFPYCY
jgi:hypothetical protein